MRTFLDRIDALRNGSDPNRPGTREQDEQAVALLEQRKLIGPAVESRLRELVGVATSLAPVPDQEPPSPDAGERQKIAQEFHAWLTDWREQARTLITRRDYQIRLGLTEPRSVTRSEDSEDEDEDQAVANAVDGATPPPEPQ